MSYSFSGTAEDLTPSEGGNQPTQPYIGPARLVAVNLDSPTQAEGKPEYDVIQFHFELLDGDEKETVYRHIEWEPNSQDKATNAFRRVGHILSQFIPGDKEEAKEKSAKVLASEDWETFRQKVDKIFNEKMGEEKFKKKKLIIKLVGEVIKQGSKAGDTRFGFTNYLGFIGDERSEKSPTFGPNERQNNAEYQRALEGAPQPVGGSSAGSTGQDDDLGVSIDVGEEEEDDDDILEF